MGYNIKNYRKQGGEEWVVGGELTVEDGGSVAVESGGEVDIESGGALKIAGTQVTASAAELNELDHDASVADGHGRVRVARATYDISGGDDGTVGSHGLGVTIPDNAIILDGVIDVITTFTDNADDSATIAIQVEGGNDIVTATAISGGSDIWDAGLQDIIPDGAAANMVKTTAAKEITAVVADDEIDAGKLVVFLRYVVSE
jgi:hypothetical protein